MSGIGIYGLSGSGIDVDSMVRMGMMTKQNEYDKMYKQEVKNEWIKEAYADMYNSLNTFNSSTLYDYKLSSTTSPMSATSSQSTVATAVANADAASMSHTVNVERTASNAYLLSADKIKRNNTNLSESIYLKDVLFTKEEQDTLNGEISGDTEEAKKKADSALLSFDIADGTESDSKKKTISFTYEEILKSNLTLNDLSSRINQSGVNIKAGYDSANDAFSLYQKDGGVDNKILLTVKSGDAYANGSKLLNNLQLASVTQDLDGNNQLTSKLSDVMTVETTTGTSSIGGAKNTYTSSITVGNDTTLDSLFSGVKVGNDTPITFTLYNGNTTGGMKETFNLGGGLTIGGLISQINHDGGLFTASLDDGHLTIKAKGSDETVSFQVDNTDTSEKAENGRYLINALKFSGITEELSADTIGLGLEVVATQGTGSIGGAAQSYTSTNTVDANTELVSPLKFSLTDGTNTNEFNLSGNVTIGKLMQEINDTGKFSAELDDNSNLKISAGDGKVISFVVDNSDTSTEAENGRNFLNELKFSGITTKLSADTKAHTQGTSGISAEVVIDGRTYHSDTSKLSVGNVTYTLASKGSTTVTVNQDTDKLVENVKKFVEDYNKMIDELNEKYYEEKYSDYGVLTQTQEKGMTKEQIDKWNEKAKSGLMNHDQNIGKIISEMRQAIYTPVESATGKYNTMMSIGISSSTDRGHLKLDEDKLKKALAEEPDAVREIFNSSGDYTDKNGKVQTDYDKQGVIGRISDSLYKNLKTMKSYAGTSTEAADGSSLGDLIRELQTKMSNFKTMMKSYENMLYKKYDAMELAIQRMSVSMGYITGGQ